MGVITCKLIQSESLLRCILMMGHYSWVLQCDVITCPLSCYMVMIMMLYNLISIPAMHFYGTAPINCHVALSQESVRCWNLYIYIYKFLTCPRIFICVESSETQGQDVRPLSQALLSILETGQTICHWRILKIEPLEKSLRLSLAFPCSFTETVRTGCDIITSSAELG